MGTRAPSAWALAQVVVATAVLAGLFLMHGLATLDCDGRAGTATSMTTPSMADRPMGTPLTIGGHAMAATSMAGLPPHGSPTAGGDSGGQGIGIAGAVCVSTPPPSGLAGLLAMLLLLAVGALVVAWSDPITRLPRGHGRRAPPLAGSELLLDLCISRT